MRVFNPKWWGLVCLRKFALALHQMGSPGLPVQAEVRSGCAGWELAPLGARLEAAPALPVGWGGVGWAPLSTCAWRPGDMSTARAVLDLAGQGGTWAEGMMELSARGCWDTAPGCAGLDVARRRSQSESEKQF